VALLDLSAHVSALRGLLSLEYSALWSCLYPPEPWGAWSRACGV